MSTDKPQDTEAEGAHVAPDPLAMSVASTAEDYTAEKLTPDPGSDIGRAIPVNAGVEELPDTAEKEGGPTQYTQLPDDETDEADDVDDEAEDDKPEVQQAVEQPSGQWGSHS